MNWRDYFFHTDFSSDEANLRRLPVGQLSANNVQMLAAILSSNDTGPGKNFWSPEGENGDWALINAVVIQNGLNARSLPTKYSFTNALVVELPESSIAPAGRIYIQFNAPADTPLPIFTDPTDGEATDGSEEPADEPA